MLVVRGALDLVDEGLPDTEPDDDVAFQKVEELAERRMSRDDG